MGPGSFAIRTMYQTDNLQGHIRPDHWLAVKRYRIYEEELFPFSADEEELGRDNIHHFIQHGLRNFASIAGQDATALTRKPKLRSSGRWRTLAHVHMNRLAILVRPKENAITAYKEQARQP